ncbi:HNH endonuclease [Pseudoalteromonas xiamenensis]
MTVQNLSAELQLQFISYIQRLVAEGEFSATYKFALLNAIADICIETPQNGFSRKLEIPFTRIIEKMIQLYWDQASLYNMNDSETPNILYQNSASQVKIIKTINQLKATGTHSFSMFLRAPFRIETVKSLFDSIKTGPIERLQTLSGQCDAFLYPIHFKRSASQSYSIVLNEGIADCFRKFYDLVIHIARNAWTKKVISINKKKGILSNNPSVEAFLFSNDRKNLSSILPVLTEIQSNKCFYCQKAVSSPDESNVDHFIPFSRYSNDTAHNFVMAHASCNNAKSDYLAAFEHRDRWLRQNLDTYRHVIDEELKQHVHSEPALSLAISNWAYAQANEINAKLWISKNEYQTIRGNPHLDMVAE